MSKQDGILDLVVKGEWFDKIVSADANGNPNTIN